MQQAYISSYFHSEVWVYNAVQMCVWLCVLFYSSLPSLHKPNLPQMTTLKAFVLYRYLICSVRLTKLDIWTLLLTSLAIWKKKKRRISRWMLLTRAGVQNCSRWRNLFLANQIDLRCTVWAVLFLFSRDKWYPLLVGYWFTLENIRL